MFVAHASQVEERRLPRARVSPGEAASRRSQMSARSDRKRVAPHAQRQRSDRAPRMTGQMARDVSPFVREHCAGEVSRALKRGRFAVRLWARENCVLAACHRWRVADRYGCVPLKRKEPTQCWIGSEEVSTTGADVRRRASCRWGAPFGLWRARCVPPGPVPGARHGSALDRALPGGRHPRR